MRQLLMGVIGAIVLLQFAGPSSAQENTSRVSDLGTEINNVVTVEGFVTRYQEDFATTELYHLRDDWGGVVMVRTTKPRPKVGERLRVTGTVTVDLRLNAPSIIETERAVLPALGAPSAVEKIEDSDGDGVPDATDRCPQQYGPAANGGCPETNYLLYALFAATIVVVVALVVVLIKMRSLPVTKPEEPVPGRSVGTCAFMPDGAEVIEGATIKMHAPPPNTLKLLPGSFEVVAGEPEIEEIRLYRTSPDPEIETTIGRLPGEPYKHIQLKLQTVSRKQAKLVFSNGNYTLINYAPDTSNPTRINGQEMAVNESRVLEEGDRIQMGEVELIYHS